MVQAWWCCSVHPKGRKLGSKMISRELRNQKADHAEEHVCLELSYKTVLEQDFHTMCNTANTRILNEAKAHYG